MCTRAFSCVRSRNPMSPTYYAARQNGAKVEGSHPSYRRCMRITKRSFFRRHTLDRFQVSRAPLLVASANGRWRHAWSHEIQGHELVEEAPCPLRRTRRASKTRARRRNSNSPELTRVSTEHDQQTGWWDGGRRRWLRRTPALTSVPV
jgi:hypothetical protein